MYKPGLIRPHQKVEAHEIHGLATKNKKTKLTNFIALFFFSKIPYKKKKKKNLLFLGDRQSMNKFACGFYVFRKLFISIELPCILFSFVLSCLFINLFRLCNCVMIQFIGSSFHSFCIY